jgi:hypothetical protein
MSPEQAKQFFIDQFRAIRQNQLQQSSQAANIATDPTMVWLDTLTALSENEAQFVEQITPQVQLIIEHFHKTIARNERPDATSEERKLLEYTEKWLTQYQLAAQILGIPFTHTVKNKDGVTITHVSHPVAHQPMVLEPEQVLATIEKNLVTDNLNSAWEKLLDNCYHVSAERPAGTHEEFESITGPYFKLTYEENRYVLVWRADTQAQLHRLRASLMQKLRESNPHHKTMFYAQQLTRLMNAAVADLQKAS